MRPAAQSDGNDANMPKDPLKARCLLMIGGIFGFHRLYLNQIPEAFIFLSTAGVFMLGVFYDSFYMHDMVEEHNQRLEADHEDKKKYRNGYVMQRSSRMLVATMNNLVLSILYGIWLGFLTWSALSVTFGKTMQDGVLMISVIASAVSAGIYIFGNREGQSRDLLYIWVPAFSAAFIVGKILNASFLKVLLFSAISGSVIGNRTARARSAVYRPFNWKHFIFWSSLFACLLCVITIGATKHILHQKVSASRPGQSTVISTLGSLVQDRFYYPNEVHRFFQGSPKITFKKVTTAEDKESKRSNWLDFDLVGKAPQWADHLTVFTVNILRAESRVLDGNLKEEPLKWAMWRLYIAVHFDLPAYSTDRDFARVCSKWKKDNDIKRKESTLKENEEYVNSYAYRAIERGCEVSTL